MTELRPQNSLDAFEVLHSRLDAHFSKLKQRRQALSTQGPVFAQPLSWGAVLAYVLSLDKDHPTGDLLTSRVRLVPNALPRHAAASDTSREIPTPS